MSAALIVQAITNRERHSGCLVAEGQEDVSADVGDTETPLMILLRGSFKLDNNDCLWSTRKKGNSYRASIRHISRFHPNYFPASGGGVSSRASESKGSLVRPSSSTYSFLLSLFTFLPLPTKRTFDLTRRKIGKVSR